MSPAIRYYSPHDSHPAAASAKPKSLSAGGRSLRYLACAAAGFFDFRRRLGGYGPYAERREKLVAVPVTAAVGFLEM